MAASPLISYEQSRTIFSSCEKGLLLSQHVSNIPNISKLADINGKTLMDIAIEGKHVSTVDLLFSCGFSTFRRETWFLGNAVKSGISKIVSLVLQNIPDPYPFVTWVHLMDAARLGFTDIVSQLMQYQTEADRVNIEEALMAACKAGHVAIVQILIRAGADPLQWVLKGGIIVSGFSSALYHGRHQVVDFLLDNGLIFDHNDEKILISAARGGVIDVIAQLFEHGDYGAWNLGEALREACAGGHVDVIRAILHKANFFVGRAFLLSDVLYVALRGGHADAAMVLLKETDVCAEEADWSKRSPLAPAVTNSCVKVVELMLGMGCPVNPPSDSPFPILYLASDPRIIKVLLDHGALVDPPGPYSLESACRAYNPEAVKLLLQAGARVKGNGRHYPPLFTTIMHHCPEGKLEAKLQVVRHLLAAGADPCQATQGLSALNACVIAASDCANLREPIAVACAILEHCPEALNAVDVVGMTPLMVAAEAKSVPMVEFFIQCGARLDSGTTGIEGMSPLSQAVRFRSSWRERTAISRAHDIIIALMGAGATPGDWDNQGMTTFMHAVAPRCVADPVPDASIAYLIEEVCRGVLRSDL